MNFNTRPLTILVSPLDWGLGHASRMIPIIGRFVQDKHSVILAGSGRSSELLRSTFPGLRFVSLPGANIRMGAGKHSYFQLLLQLPALAFSVFREHRLIRKIVRNDNVDIIISDNRYGLHCRKTYSVLITHQVSPVLPAIFRWFEFPLYLIIRSLIHRFDQCWIPDHADADINLSGKLSHRFKKPVNARFIGILSRFSLREAPTPVKPAMSYEIAVVLSGPEPQVSVFEKQVFTELTRLKKSAILIRGMREKPIEGSGPSTSYIHEVSHLEATPFIQVLKQAGIVISRSGYSGIMDFIALGISAILVPSPGQSEQEFLASRMSEKGWFSSVTQDKFDLAEIYRAYPHTRKQVYPLSLGKTGSRFIEDLYLENCKDGD